jgi:hypothetical protein
LNVKNGLAEVFVMETMSAMPIEYRVAMSVVVVSRKGIDSVRPSDGKVLQQSPIQKPKLKCRGGQS